MKAVFHDAYRWLDAKMISHTVKQDELTYIKPNWYFFMQAQCSNAIYGMKELGKH